MTPIIRRTYDEIQAVLNKAADANDRGKTDWPDKSYEHGVLNAIMWMLGDYDNEPLAHRTD